MISVVWVSLHPEIAHRGYFDQGLLEALFAGEVWTTPDWPLFEHLENLADAPDEGAIVVVPAQHHVSDVDEINAAIARLGWVLLILTGDEEALCPWKAFSHPNMAVWVQPGRPGHHEAADRRMGFWWPPGTPQMLAEAASEKSQGWFFAGQANNRIREEAVGMLRGRARRHSDGEAIPTKGFLQGIDRPEYLRRLARAKVAPCPSAVHTADTFRFYEALEAGCVPIVDDKDRYWAWLYGEVPFPVVDRWKRSEGLLESCQDPELANRCFAWWQQRKRDIAWWLRDDLTTLGALGPVARGITVLMPTSPIPTHPSTSIIEVTIASIRERLPHAEIIIQCEGGDSSVPWLGYLKELLWKTNHEWDNVVPVLHSEHLHQTGMLLADLPMVRTPYLLYVEHDTPLTGEIPFEHLSAVLGSDDLRLIRLYPFTDLEPAHSHLHLDHVVMGGLEFVRTNQWSQRPNLAQTAYYAWLAEHYLEPGWFIEEAMYPVLDGAWRDDGWLGWSEHRVGIWTPEGNMQRSLHLDGRRTL